MGVLHILKFAPPSTTAFLIPAFNCGGIFFQDPATILTLPPDLSAAFPAAVAIPEYFEIEPIIFSSVIAIFLGVATTDPICCPIFTLSPSFTYNSSSTPIFSAISSASKLPEKTPLFSEVKTALNFLF